MQKVQKGFLESKIEAVHQQLLAAIDGVDGEVLNRPNSIARDYSVIDILNYLAAWGETVNKGLREIQRRKKPTELQRAIEDQKQFRQQAVAESQDDELPDILIRLEDVLFAYEDQLRQLNHDDLNRPKRFRFIGNKPLWPFIAKHTYQHDADWVEEIVHFIKRNS